MVSRPQVEVARATGIVGDRYADGTGYWKDSRVSRDLTLVEGEVIDDLCTTHGIDLQPGDTRRNITTRAVRLDELLGRPFWIGGFVLAEGTGPCEPCRHLEELTGERLVRPMIHRGGLRARALRGGTIRVGDTIETADVHDGVGVLVVRRGRVLLSRRLAPHGAGTWAPPGGKPLAGESTLECAARELAEETGLVAGQGIIVGESVDGFPESRQVFLTSFVLVADVSGDPQTREPDKHGPWEWLAWQALPAPFASLVASGWSVPATH